MESYKALDFSETCDKNAEPFIKLWMLRILVNLSAANEFVQRHDFKDDNIAEFLGLGHYIEEDIEFRSPSGAAKFVNAGNVNGWNVWKNKKGKSLV